MIMEWYSGIKERLDELGETQASLARYVGVTKASVTNWLNGTNEARPEHKLLIAKFLKWPVSRLDPNQLSPIQEATFYMFRLMDDSQIRVVHDLSRSVLANSGKD